MKNWIKGPAVLSILSMLLIAACGTLKTPQEHAISSISPENSELKLCNFRPLIPINPDDAFFPLLPDGSGVFYSWYDVYWMGLKKEYVQQDFLFSDKCAMKWFYDNDYGLGKRGAP